MSLITLAGPGLQVVFDYTDDRLMLQQLQRQDDAPLLSADDAGTAGPGPVGNPLAVVIGKGQYAGIYGMASFSVASLTHDERHLLAFLVHDTLPMQLLLQVEVDGHVATWRGQVAWNGDEALEADIYFPLLSRVRCDAPERDRALMPFIAGSVQEPLSTVEFSNAYLGLLSAPFFLVEGGGRGLAVHDDNRADFAPDPGTTVKRTYVVGNTFPQLEKRPWLPRDYESTYPGGSGPFLGICHTRVFRPVGAFDVPAPRETSPQRFDAQGDLVDLGPIRTYAYQGTWKTGAQWLREERRHVPFRTSPARWYQQTTFIAEDMGDDMLKRGQTFYDFPQLMAQKETLGSNFFHIPGFHDPEVLGTTHNWRNRGDYVFAAQNLGGFDAMRKGIDAIHRRGGHILYYVEGLIMLKRSRIGREHGKEWALMKEDGSYDDHYPGFWHMCPGSADWRQWLAQTCAEIVRTTEVDGFFIDSTCATHHHRCFNPAHHHPHPDTWNWGLRQLLREVREAVDSVNPETILFVEGCGDMAREFIDGFVTHSHAWTRQTFTEPLIRFVYPDMRAFESWGNDRLSPTAPEVRREYLHVWNSVTGHRIYSHTPGWEEMAPLSARTRRYYDSFPEICERQLSMDDVAAENCLACLFDGLPRVMTIGNLSDQPVQATVMLPAPCGMLFDRVDSTRVPVANGTATLPLAPWEFRAFELRA